MINSQIPKWIIGLYILALISCDNIESTSNSSPSVENLAVYNTILLSNWLEYDTEYSFRCRAEDLDDDPITYTWIFESYEYKPFIWETRTQTVTTETDTISWLMDVTGDLEIYCFADDGIDTSNTASEQFIVKSPNELTEFTWYLDGVMGVGDTIVNGLDNDIFLNIDYDNYFGSFNPCGYMFGQISVFEDTLSFEELCSDLQPVDCPEDSSGVFNFWSLFNHYRYQYSVLNDTLELFIYDDTTAVYRCRFHGDED